MSNKQSQGRLNLAVYIGWFRWENWNGDGKRDYSREMLGEIASSGHRVCAVLLRRGDRLAYAARELGLDVLHLPPQLCRPIRESKALFHSPEWNADSRLAGWFDRFASLRPDLGLIYAGGWLPRQLFEIPAHGFVNFHPGPLPELPGYLPEFFLAFRRNVRPFGTLHHVDECIDSGRVVAHTPRLRLPAFVTPRDVGIEMQRFCPPLLKQYMDDLAAGRTRCPPERAAGVAFKAGIAAAAAESRIDWERDSHRKIEIRQRCFCCSPHEVLPPLHALLDGEIREVLAVETHLGEYPGPPGRRIGVYGGTAPFDGAPVIRTLEGAAVAVPGRKYEKGWLVSVAPEFIVRGGRRKKRTEKRGIRIF